MTEAALEIDGLSYGYGRGFALEDISFRIGKGEFTALLGPNGAGKTTLFSLITRLFEAPRGTIRVCGINLREHPTQALAHMGVVFQQPTLDLDLTVRQNLHYFASLHGIGRRDAAERIDEALDRLGHGRARRGKGPPVERRPPPPGGTGARPASPPRPSGAGRADRRPGRPRPARHRRACP